MSTSYYETCAISKGEPRKRVKARKARAETVVKRQVRAVVDDRDGYCRYWKDAPYDDDWTPCDGPSEWAHWGDRKRFKTRGMAPEVRHTTAGSLMLCQRHHRAYDAGELEIKADTDRGCDGPLSYRWRTL